MRGSVEMSRAASVAARVSIGASDGAASEPSRRQRFQGLPSRATEVVADPASIARRARGTFVTRGF
jgi:hypothetical protein